MISKKKRNKDIQTAIPELLIHTVSFELHSAMLNALFTFLSFILCKILQNRSKLTQELFQKLCSCISKATIC